MGRLSLVCGVWFSNFDFQFWFSWKLFFQFWFAKFGFVILVCEFWFSNLGFPILVCKVWFSNFGLGCFVFNLVYNFILIKRNLRRARETQCNGTRLPAGRSEELDERVRKFTAPMIPNCAQNNSDFRGGPGVAESSHACCLLNLCDELLATEYDGSCFGRHAFKLSHPCKGGAQGTLILSGSVRKKNWTWSPSPKDPNEQTKK